MHHTNSSSLLAQQSGFMVQQMIGLMKQKLAETILRLQSDEVIEQMRNDTTLYQYKITHIKEIIHDCFNIQDNFQKVLGECQRLRGTVRGFEAKIRDKDREFAQAIDMIQESAKKHTLQKQHQLHTLAQTITQLQSQLHSAHQSASSLSKKTSQQSETIQELTNQSNRLQKELQKNKEQIHRLNQLNRKYKSGSKESENQYERVIAGMKMDFQREVHEYEGLLRKMQADLGLVKGEWQRKCLDNQKALREYYEAEILKLEDKKTRELIQHIETVKEGKPVIIKQDEEILVSRMESVRRQYEAELEKQKRQASELQQMYEALQNSHISRMKELEGVTEALKVARHELEEERESMAQEKDKSKREVEKLKAILLEFERNNKDIMLGMEEKVIEIVKLGDQIKFLEKKADISNRSLTDLKAILESKEDQIQKYKTRVTELTEATKKLKKSIDTLESDAQLKNKKLQTLTKQLQNCIQLSKQQQQAQQEYKAQIKSLRICKKNLHKIVNKLGVQLKQAQKEMLLLKQEIRYTLEVGRKKSVAEVEKLRDQLKIYQDHVHRDNKIKMNDLINQLEEAKEIEHQEFQNIIRERDNLKKDISELETLFEKKEREADQASRIALHAQAEETRRLMMEELQRQKLKYKRLEDQLATCQRDHHRKLDKTKSEVKSAIRVLTSKWVEEISRLEEDNRKKESDIQRIMEKVQQVINESTDLKQNYQSEKQELRKLRKKYDTLRQEKDEQMADLLKRLERESKHKINLEKQLRAIRSEFNRGDRYAETETKGAGLGFGNSVTDRQREITEIRELIAKTYQAVGEKPEKDYKLDRKKSPY